jgi:hypothetical protein
MTKKTLMGKETAMINQNPVNPQPMKSDESIERV